MIVVANPFGDLTDQAMNGITRHPTTETALYDPIVAFIFEGSVVGDDGDLAMGGKVGGDLEHGGCFAASCDGGDGDAFSRCDKIDCSLLFG